MEKTVQKFLGPMIDDISLPLDRQYQQNLSEWAVKCAMCNDTADLHPRFFTEAECHKFNEKRTIPHGTLVFAARFIGRSLDSNGVDFTLTEPASGDLLVRAHIYNVMVGHVVLQVLSWHPEPSHIGKIIRFAVQKGCEWLEILLKSISPPPHDHLVFLGRVQEIADLASKDTEQALRELDRFEDALKNAPDGHGSVILNSERHEKYLV